MRPRSLNSILDECLAAMRRGESLDGCLARYPRQAGRLRPLLLLAQQVSRTPPARARPWAEGTAWHAVRQRAAELRSGKRRRASVGPHYGAWLRPLAVAAVLVLALLGAGGGTALAAQDTLPDHPLYRVKLTTEEVRLWFVFDDDRRAEILLDQSNERVEEMMALIRQGKPISANVLSALEDRNQRAAEILQDNPSQTALRARVLSQAESQERVLVALWPDISDSARYEYSKAVAGVHNARLQGGGAAAVSVSPEDLSGGVLDIAGQAEPLGNGIWRIGGVEVRVDERTIGYDALKQGAKARLIVGRSSNGRLQALSLSTLGGDSSASGTVVSGAIEEITSEGIRVAGQLYPVTPETLVKLKLKQGERVQLTLGSTASGIAVTSVKPLQSSAQATDPAAFTYEGTIEGDIDRTNAWTIGELRFAVTSATSVDAKAGRAEPGARVLVEAVNQHGELQAQDLTVLASGAAAGSAYLVGTYQGQKDGYWIVSGLEVAPPEDSAAPEDGALVAMDVSLEDGQLQSVRVVITESSGSALVRFKGTVQDIKDSTWTLELGQIRVTSKAQVSGKAVVGGRVLGWARVGRDGAQEAVYVRALDERPVTQPPTPTPTPAPSPAPTPAR